MAGSRPGTILIFLAPDGECRVRVPAMWTRERRPTYITGLLSGAGDHIREGKKWDSISEVITGSSWLASGKLPMRNIRSR